MKASQTTDKNKEDFSKLFETMDLGVVYQDAEGNITSANPAAEKILGLSLDQMLGRTSMHPEWRAVGEDGSDLPGESHPAMVALQARKKISNFLQGIYNPQIKDYVWILVNSIPQFRKGSKEPYQVYSTFLDITERKNAEEAFAHSHDLMRYIIENSNSAIAVHDKDLNYIYVSQDYLKQYKVKKKNIIGKHHYEVFPDLPQKWRDVHKKALAGEISSADEDPFKREDGTIEWTRWECRPWYEANGSIGGIIVYTEVITDRKKTEEQLKSLNQQLRANEQQLRAANQQLQANEQELQASNQQLKASEQQLLAANQQLRANEQQLRAANQQLQAANLQLQESESKYRSLFNSMQEGLYLHRLVYDDKGKAINYRIIDANRISEKYLTIKREDAIGKLATELFGTAEAPFLAEYSKVAKTGEPFFFEQHFAPMDKHFLISVFSPKKGDFATVFLDISNLKQTEKALMGAKEKAEENEAKFRELFNNVNNAIFIYNPETFEILEANKATSEIYGYSHDELIGMSCLKFSAEVEESKSVGKLIKDKGQGKINIKLRHHKKKDGTDVFVELSTFNILVNGKNITYSVCHDITNIKKAEVDLIKAKDKAEESDRLKSAFLANMSHEIRTPMNGIIGFTSILKEADLSGDERSKYIKIIEKSGERMLGTINDIIDFSRIESGEVKTRIKPLNINSLLESLYDFFEPEADKKKLKLIFKSGLDNAAAEIKTDPEKLHAIFTNLIKNALKFTDEGSVEFGYTHENKNIHYYVKDTGQGIGKQKIESIFDRFIQEDDAYTRTQQGSGLGLSIVKAYVELLGGKIWVESVKGEGSTFHFTIPYQPNKKGASTTEPGVKKTKDEKTNLTNKTILVVEDDNSSFEYLEVVLMSFGVNTIKLAQNGEEAIKQCKENPEIDLVLMDVNMPVMNGYEATKTIKAFRPDLPIIAQTAYALTGDREKSINAGCDDYITKPIKRAELLKKIKKFLN